MIKILKSNKYPCIAAFVALTVMVVTLFVLRLGVADNGYLTARLVSFGLYDAQGVSGTGYYSTLFGVADKVFSFKPGDLVYSIFKLMTPIDSTISVAFPALIYILLAVCGIFMIVKALECDSKMCNIIICVLTVLIVAETGYVTFFNTPYECGAAIGWFIPFIGALLMYLKYEKLIYAIIFGIFGVLFAGTMPQSGAVGIILSVFVIYLAFKNGAIVSKVVLAVIGVLMIASSIFAFYNISDADKYNSVFYGVASSENVQSAEVLKELGIYEKEYLVGVDYFKEEAQTFISSPEFDEVMKHATPMKIAGLYTRNTEYLTESVKYACNNAMHIKTEYLSNYSNSSKKPWQTSGFFSMYSYVKKTLVPGNFILLFIFFAGVVMFSLDYKKQYAETAGTKNACVFCVFMAVASLISLFVPVICCGRAQIGFNLIIYNLMFDSIIVASAVGGIKLMAAKRKKLRDKFGVNQ